MEYMSGGSCWDLVNMIKIILYNDKKKKKYQIINLFNYNINN